MSTELTMENRQEEIRSHGNLIVEQSKEIQVVCDESFHKAGELLLNIKTYIAKAKEFCRPNIERWHQGWKKALQDEKLLIGSYEEAETIIKPRLASYHEDQERKRREEEERLRQEAIKKADEERLADAISADQSGMKDLSDAILDGPAYVPTVVAPKSAATVAGISFRDQWKAEVFDLKALLRAVLENKVPVNVIDANMTVLNGLARNLKGQLNYPGVRIIVEKITSGRSI